MRLVLSALLFLAACAPRPAHAEDLPERAEHFRAALIEQLDPNAADEFLGDEALAGFLKQNMTESYAKLPRYALQLKDLRDLFEAHADDTSGYLLNRAFQCRFVDNSMSYFGFNAHPAELIAWRQKHLPGLKNINALKQAIWEWDSLPVAQKKWLLAGGQTQETWQGSSFPARQKLSGQWAGSLYDLLLSQLKGMPKSMADWGEINRTNLEIRQGLSDSQTDVLNKYLRWSKEGIRRRNELSHNYKVLNTQRLRALLDQAKTAGSLEGSLTSLGQIFDALGINAPTFQAVRPPSAEQRIAGPRQRALLESMLAGAWLEEIGAVESGRQIQQFYKTRPLVLKIGSLSASNFAKFEEDDRTITVNQDALVEWLKTRRLTVHDLCVKPAAFQEFVMVLAPALIHESVHFEQLEFRKSRDLPDWSPQDLEVEAEAFESLYVLERAQQPCRRGASCYQSFLQRSQADSALVRDDVELADELNRKGRQFPNFIKANYYPGTDSIEDLGAYELPKNSKDSGEIKADIGAYVAYKKYHKEFMDRIFEGIRRLHEAESSRPHDAVAPPVPKDAGRGVR